MKKHRPGRLVSILTIGWILSSCGGWAPVREGPSVSDAPSVYRVQPGDTLIKISWRYGLDYRQIAAWNQLDAPDRILAGQRLRLVPPGVVAVDSNKVDNKLVDKSRTAPQRKDSEASAASASQTVIISAAADKRRTKDSVEWRWPLSGTVVQRFQSGALGRNGIGIDGRQGQAINAASAGEVVYSGSGLPGYGRLVIVRHSKRLLSAYGHLGKIVVSEGDRIVSGQKIAELGTNNNNQAVLHFEIRKNGKPVNPLGYLPG